MPDKSQDGSPVKVESPGAFGLGENGGGADKSRVGLGRERFEHRWVCFRRCHRFFCLESIQKTYGKTMQMIDIV